MSWFKPLNQDTTSMLSANDFELAILDYSYLEDSNRYRKNIKYLNWFIYNSPSLYTSSIDSYASYLTYIIIIRMFTDSSFDINFYETYFSNQLVGLLESKRDITNLKNLSLLVDYWKKAFSLISYIANLSSAYSSTVTYTPIYFNAHDNYKIDIPFIGVKNNDTVDCFLILTYFNKKPSWYTVATIYKIYGYYSNLGIKISTLNIFWLNSSNFLSNYVVESIPLTDNVIELISRYVSVVPYPYKNIFNKDNFEYYNKIPLETILK